MLLLLTPRYLALKNRLSCLAPGDGFTVGRYRKTIIEDAVRLIKGGS